MSQRTCICSWLWRWQESMGGQMPGVRQSVHLQGDNLRLTGAYLRAELSQKHRQKGLVPAQGQLALTWLPDSGPFLSHPLPPDFQNFNSDFRRNFRFDAVSDGASHFLTEFWCPRNRVLVLAEPFIYHSLKLSYLLPYLLSAFSHY